MNQAKIFDLKNRLSFYLNKVRRGQKVRVYDRNRPIADIVPLQAGPGPAAESDYLLNLEAEGILRTPKKRPSRFLFSTPPGNVKTGDKAINDLLAERDSE